MNIIVIVLDSLRRDHLGCYGNSWMKTPNLDKFSEQAVSFDNAFAEGLPTIPVRTELITGQTSLPFRPWQPLVKEDVTAAELLRRHGYLCGMVADTYHMFKPDMNFHRGMHSYQWIRGQESDAYKPGPAQIDTSWCVPPAMKGTPVANMLVQYLRNVSERKREEDYFCAQVMRTAVDWLKDAAGRSPFFLWVDSFDPHEPWDPPPDFEAMYADPDYDGYRLIHPKYGPVDWMSDEELTHVKALYAGEVSFVDKWTGKLLDALDKSGLADDTAVLIMADHGHPHGDHGLIMKHDSNLYAELVRIPLLLRHPKGLHAGERVDGLVQIRDILPTLLDVAGLPAPVGMHGTSAWPLVSGEADSIREYAVSGYHESPYRTVRDKRWALIVTPDGQDDELYDMIADPTEQKNIIAQHRDVAERMRSHLGEYTFTKRPRTWMDIQTRYEVSHTPAG